MSSQAQGNRQPLALLDPDRDRWERDEVSAEEMVQKVCWRQETRGWCSLSVFSPQYGKKKLKYLPYNHQHEYFFLSEYGCLSSPTLLSPQHSPLAHFLSYRLQTEKMTADLFKRGVPAVSLGKHLWAPLSIT